MEIFDDEKIRHLLFKIGEELKKNGLYEDFYAKIWENNLRAGEDFAERKYEIIKEYASRVGLNEESDELIETIKEYNN